AFHRGAMPQVDRPRRTSFWEAGADETPEATEESRAAAAQVAEVLELFRSVCAREEEELGRIDAIAGDGDHGQGMTYGSKGAATAAQEALEAGAGARTLLVRAGEAWSESAGGTSGALWGAALTAAGGVFDDRAGVESRTVVDAVEAGIDAIQRLGGAKVGDKTMVDAAAPFRETLEKSFTGDNAAEAILEAAGVAREAADATADITATLGRARVLGEKSIGTPDPGAISFSILVKELCQLRSWPGTRTAPRTTTTGIPPPRVPRTTTATKEELMALQIIVGGDNAGFGYKEELKALLEDVDRVESVFD